MTPGTEHSTLRREVTGFLASQSFAPVCDSWVRGYSPAFSKAVAAQGWIGMSWPREHGGEGRSNVERWIVTEELLRAGAPVAAHWTADRQIGPTLMRLGTEEQRKRLVGPIRRGEVVVALGLSESEAGSDLSSLRTRADRIDGGWVINGTKIWTTSAHVATHLYVLARSERADRPQQGLTEFLFDARTPGVEVRPILDLSGQHHFNEVLLTDVFVEDTAVLGETGQGWHQVTEQLAFERGGAERYLSTYPLIKAMLEAARHHPDRAANERLGSVVARLTAIRSMGLDLATRLDAGEAPTQQAARLKLLGTLFEQDLIDSARYVFDVCAATNDQLALLADATRVAPSSTIRGGSTEIMRTVIARSVVSR